ncbi:hypothetical protein ACJX0J_034589, partial [Zea mays]
GFQLGGLRQPPAPPLPPPVHGGEGGAAGFVRSYLTAASSAALGKPSAGKTVDWRYVLASPHFRRLFSDGSKKNYENYYPKGKKEVPKGDGTNKSESKQESNTDEGWNFQDNAMKHMQNFLAPLLILGLMLSSMSSSSADQKEISFQDITSILLEEAQEALGIDPHDFVPVTYVAEVNWFQEVMRMQSGFNIGGGAGKGRGGIFNIGKATFVHFLKNPKKDGWIWNNFWSALGFAQYVAVLQRRYIFFFHILFLLIVNQLVSYFPCLHDLQKNHNWLGKIRILHHVNF